MSHGQDLEATRHWLCALPSASDLVGASTITGLRAFLQVGDELWAAFIDQVGDPGDHIRVLAALPSSALVQGCVGAQLPTGDNFSAVQATHVGLLWRTCRKLVHVWAGLPERDFVGAGHNASDSSGSRQQTSEQVTSSGGQGQVKERVLKMASLIDQGDDSELVPASREQIDAWLSVYISVMGSVPQEEEEPSEGQLAALHKRVFILKGPPYTDFALWTPLARNSQRQQKFRVYRPLGDGSYLMQELPGPQNYQQWLTSWRVFRTAAIMLNIASLSTLHGYEKAIERLTIQWPRCWGLIAYAEDKARADRLDKIRRRLQQDAARGKEMPTDWTEDNPWNSCLKILTHDEDFWNEQIRHPAASWMASGGKGVPMAPAEQAALAHIPGGSEIMDIEQEGHGDNRRRQANRDKRAAKARRIKAEREELDTYRRKSQPSDGKSGGQDKGRGKGKSKDQAGTQICFSWANGSGICGSVEPGGACLQKDVKDESDDQREQPAGSLLKKEVKREEDVQQEQSAAPWVPDRVTKALKGAKSFKEFKERRVFNFVHFFSGVKDVLGEAVKRMADLQGIKVKVYALDKEQGIDLSAQQPFGDMLDLTRTGEIDASHCGFPCGSFSRARYREGSGPPPVRSSQWIYGLPTNSVRQQAEADLGSLLAIRSVQFTSDVLQSQRLRAVPDCGTLENPPGSEDQREGPAWMLPELVNFMRQFGGETADYNTCGFQQKERTRWWKPGRFGGKLTGMQLLVRKCNCPKFFRHEPLIGKEKTSRAAEYPAELCLEYAKLLMKNFNTVLELEWWRHQQATKESQLNEVKEKWAQSKNRRIISKPVPDDVMKDIRGCKRAWDAEDVDRDLFPLPARPSKRARREEENRAYLGGMRNPKLALRKLTVLKEAGQDIHRLWTNFVKDMPEALEVA
eukprot:s5122_g4.t1